MSQDQINSCMDTSTNYWCSKGEDSATNQFNCNNQCSQICGPYHDECNTYCNGDSFQKACPPSPPSQALFYGDSAPTQEKHKQTLMKLTIILVIYLITTSKFVYAITNKILPTLELNGQPSLLGYSLHTVLFLLGVFLTLQ
jgi:hypothetical protein